MVGVAGGKTPHPLGNYPSSTLCSMCREYHAAGMRSRFAPNHECEASSSRRISVRGSVVGPGSLSPRARRPPVVDPRVRPPWLFPFSSLVGGGGALPCTTTLLVFGVREADGRLQQLEGKRPPYPWGTEEGQEVTSASSCPASRRSLWSAPWPRRLCDHLWKTLGIRLRPRFSRSQMKRKRDPASSWGASGWTRSSRNSEAFSIRKRSISLSFSSTHLVSSHLASSRLI